MKNFINRIKVNKEYELLLSLLLVIYIATEAILKYYNLGCSTEGCKMTINLIILSENLIYLLGFSFSLFIFILTYLKKYTFISIFLPLGFIFETIIFSYQLKNGLFCIFCFGVWSSLFLLMILNFKNNIYNIIFILFMIISISFSIFILNINYNNNKITKIDKKITFNKKIILLGFETCPYCQKTKKLLNKLNIDFQLFNINEIDMNSFFGYINWDTVPILIIKEDENTYKILKNNLEIEKYINDNLNNNNKIELNNNSLFDNTQSSNLQLLPLEEGCKINEKSNCIK